MIFGITSAHAEVDIIVKTSTVNTAITSNSLVDSMVVDRHATIRSAIVLVTIQHEDYDGLVMKLRTPDGSLVDLPIVDRIGGPQTFVHSSSTDLGLAGLVGAETSGTWSLDVRDIYRHDAVGMLGDWSLVFVASDEIQEDGDIVESDDHVHTDARIIRYHSGLIPSILDSQVLTDALALATQRWQEYNPNITFQANPVESDITVEWKVSQGPDHHDTIQCDDAVDCTVTISMGTKMCDGSYAYKDVNHTANDIMHEIGHFFGLDHHSDANHLMYAGQDSAVDDFDAREYSVPPAYDGYFIGQKELADQADDLADQYARLNAEYADLEAIYLTAYGAFNDTAHRINDTVILMNSLADSAHSSGWFGDINHRFEQASLEYSRLKIEYGNRLDETNIAIDMANTKISGIYDLADRWTSLNDKIACYPNSEPAPKIVPPPTKIEPLTDDLPVPSADRVTARY